MKGDDLKTPRREIVEFLEKKGWKILVAGKIEIRGDGLNNEFIFEFTGKKKEEG